MTATDVAHAGTTSSTHANVAKAKMAMIRCCTTVSPSMPKHVDGRFHINNVARITTAALMAVLFNYSGSRA